MYVFQVHNVTALKILDLYFWYAGAFFKSRGHIYTSGHWVKSRSHETEQCAILFRNATAYVTGDWTK